jgi:hypothetical protein
VALPPTTTLSEGVSPQRAPRRRRGKLPRFGAPAPGATARVVVGGGNRRKVMRSRTAAHFAATDAIASAGFKRPTPAPKAECCPLAGWPRALAFPLAGARGARCPPAPERLGLRLLNPNNTNLAIEHRIYPDKQYLGVTLAASQDPELIQVLTSKLSKFNIKGCIPSSLD